MLLRITIVAGLVIIGTGCESQDAATVADKKPRDLPPAPLRWEKVTSPATAVLSYDSVWYKAFPDARAAQLNAQELEQTERLLKACVETDNQQRIRAFQSRFPQESIDPGLLIELKNYNRQLVPVLNKRGEKEVWVRCLCNVPSDWRKHMALVIDGGNCYFSVKLNLTRNRWYELMINGEA